MFAYTGQISDNQTQCSEIHGGITGVIWLPLLLLNVIVFHYPAIGGISVSFCLLTFKQWFWLSLVNLCPNSTSEKGWRHSSKTQDLNSSTAQILVLHHRLGVFSSTSFRFFQKLEQKEIPATFFFSSFLRERFLQSWSLEQIFHNSCNTNKTDDELCET